MFELSPDERIALANRVVKRANGKVPVVATGTFSRNVNEMSDIIKTMYNTGVNAVVCLVNYFAEENEGEGVWIKNAELLLNKTENIPLGLYECPLPYHRCLELETVNWIVSTGRFYWLKETSENIEKVIKKNVAAKNSHLKLFNAHTESLLQSLL